MEQQKLDEEYNDFIYLKEMGLSEYFDTVAVRFRDRIAVSGDRDYNYQEIFDLSMRFSNYLTTTLGVRSGDLVGVLMYPSPESIVVVLGILRAGGVYLPIDPAYPRSRIEYIINDSSISLLVTDNNLKGEFCKNCPIVNGSKIEEHLQDYPAEFGGPKLSDTSGAYVMYTSGTTGQPKGVLINHGGVLNMILDQIKKFEISEKDIVLQFASLSFDASISEIFTALFSGATLQLLPRRFMETSGDIVSFLNEHRVTVVTLPPSLIAAIKLDNLKYLKCLISAGDRIRLDSLVELADRFRLYNAYGPTEYSVCVSINRIEPRSTYEENRSVGYPIANTRVQVVDENLSIVQPGEVGEILVSGPGLAVGYLNQPELTSEKFISLFDFAGTIWYRTGDQGALLQDGRIVVYGRRDRQVKVNGIRIELGEIECCIQQHPGVRDAVVTLNSEQRGEDVSILVFLLLEEGFNLRVVKDWLGERLPKYMMASRFIPVERIPLNTNGKPDLVALGDLLRDIPQQLNSQFLHDDQSYLLRIWKEVLCLQELDSNLDFFEHGGNSLKAIQLVSMIQDIFKVDIDLGDVFDNRSFQDQIQLINSKKDKLFHSEPVVAIEEQDHYPISHSQRRFWVLDKFKGGELSFMNPINFDVKGNLDVGRLKTSLEKLINRHEILRTSIKEIDMEPRQRILSPDTYRDFFFFTDVIDTSDPLLSQSEILSKELNTPFDQESGPLIRMHVIARAPMEFSVVLLTHHIICDGWSNDVVLRDLVAIYKSINELKELNVQYKDYAIYANRFANSDDHKQYWLSKLSGVKQSFDFPTDFFRPAIRSFHGKSIEFEINSVLVQKLDHVCHSNDASKFMGLLTLLYILLNKYTGDRDLVVGTDSAGRNQDILRDQVGMYLNTIPLRTVITLEETFDNLLKRVKDTTLGAFKYQMYPFDLLLDDMRIERSLDRSPLFDVFIVLQNLDVVQAKELSIPGLEISVEPVLFEYGKFDFYFVFIEDAGKIKGILTYNPSLFTNSRMEILIEDFVHLLDRLDPSERVISLQGSSNGPTLEEERDFLKKMNNLI